MTSTMIRPLATLGICAGLTWIAVSLLPLAHAEAGEDSAVAAKPAGSAPKAGEADGLPPIPKVKYPAEEPDAIREAYEFAALHPEILRYVPCYCLCSRSMGHKSNEDCFVKSRGETNASVVWTPHAAECPICISVAREARRRFLAGQSIRQIHDEIDAEFRPKFKYRTDTPEPPDRPEKEHR